MGFEILKSFDWIDYVVHGEAEYSFPRLLNNLAAGEPFAEVPGVSMRRTTVCIRGFPRVFRRTEMVNSPAPDYSDYLLAMQEAGLIRSFASLCLLRPRADAEVGRQTPLHLLRPEWQYHGLSKEKCARVYEEILNIS